MNLEEQGAIEESPASETETIVETPVEAPEEKPVEEKPKTVPLTALQAERRKRQELEAKAREQEARLKALEEQMSHKDPPAFDGENYEAVAEHIAEKKISQKLKEFEARREESAREEKVRVVAREYNRRLDEAHEKHADFQESYDYVNGLAASASQGFASALVHSEYVGDVVNYLAKNPTEAEKIVGLSDVEQIKAIGKIEAKLTSAPKPLKTTKAPRPISPVTTDVGDGALKWREGMSREEKRRILDAATEKGLTIKDLVG